MLPKYRLVMKFNVQEPGFCYEGEFFEHKITVQSLEKGLWQAKTSFLPPSEASKRGRSLENLLKIQGLPALMGVCKAPFLNITELYDVEIVWVEQTSEKKKIASVNRPKYELVMRFTAEESSFCYKGKFFEHEIKVRPLGNGLWQAKTSFSLPLGPSKRNRSLESLFKLEGLPALMGLCEAPFLKMKDLYNIDVIWLDKASTKQEKPSQDSLTKTKNLKSHRKSYHLGRAKSGSGPTLPPRKSKEPWDGNGPPKGAWYEE